MSLPPLPPEELEYFRGKKVAVLTGAGISTSAGIPDFQTLSTEWPFPESREEMLNIFYFQRQPERFWQAFRHAFGLLASTAPQPTPFHRWLASLEAVAEEVRIFTQNVDGLHQAAGSSQVTELHGNLKEAWDLKQFKRTGGREGRFPLEQFAEEAVPRSPLSGRPLKPSTMLFGEGIMGYGEARDAFASWADLALVAGTSLQVGPVNELPHYTTWHAHRTVALWWINREEPPEAYAFSRRFLMSTDEFAKLWPLR